MELRLHRQAHNPRGREPPAAFGQARCWTLTVSTWVKARLFFLTSKVFLNGRGAFGICFDDSLRVMQTPWQERAHLRIMGSRSREAEWRGVCLEGHKPQMCTACPGKPERSGSDQATSSSSFYWGRRGPRDRVWALAGAPSALLGRRGPLPCLV